MTDQGDSFTRRTRPLRLAAQQEERSYRFGSRLEIERHLVDPDYLEEQQDAGTHLLNSGMVTEHHPSHGHALRRLQDIAADWGTTLTPEQEEHDNPYNRGGKMFSFAGPEEDEHQGYAWMHDE